MMYLKNGVGLGFLVLMVLSFWGCAMDEYHIEYESYGWRYEGLADDTTAVVSVEHREGGHIECNHFMSYDDGESFSNVVSKKYYKVGMKSLWIGKGKGRLTDLLPAKREMNDIYPRWSDGCLAMDTLDGKFYCIEADRLDNYSYSCGFVLIDDSNADLDTLERSSCPWDVAASVSFVAHYLKVDGDFFEIREGKYVSQEPAYRMIEENGNLRFLDKNDNFVMYSGKP